MTGDYYPTSSGLQYLETNFNPETGNLSWRKDRKRDLTEDFSYDEVHKNRLASWQVTGQQLYSTTYNDANGNIKTKTDFTSPGNPYSYGLNAGPHAVTGVTEPLLMPAEAEQEIRYNSFNKASRIIHHTQNKELVLHYGPDEQRIKTEYKTNGQTTLTKYFPGGGLEVEVSANGSERWLHYLPGGGLYVCDENFNKIGMYYVLTDYLGSWDKVISETGSPIEEYSFDPWGRRRNSTNWTYTGVPSSFTFARGYTGHEMLDAFGLVNMNGRMYDPVMGRMLSPDNYVQSPGSTQAFNRYSYALNNPLVYTDPSGDMPFLVALGFMAVQGVFVGNMAKDTKLGFWGGFAYGFAAAGLSQGVGALIGPIAQGSSAISSMINAGFNSTVSGAVTYGFDAIVNNSPFNWKGWALNVGMAMAFAGLSYQKPSAQLPTYSYDGLPFEPGGGYGMSYNTPGDDDLIAAKIWLPALEITGTPINRPSPYETLRLLWDLRILGSSIPDHIALSVGINSTFIRGQSMTWSINLLTRGKEPGFFATATSAERKGFEVDWGLNFTMSNYDGNPLEINKASYLGKTDASSASFGYGGEGIIGYDMKGNIRWYGVSAGIGFSYGTSWGSGTTQQIWP